MKGHLETCTCSRLLNALKVYQKAAHFTSVESSFLKVLIRTHWTLIENVQQCLVIPRWVSQGPVLEELSVKCNKERQREFSREEGHGERRGQRKAGCGKYSEQMVEPCKGLCDSRDGVKAESQARGKMMLLFISVLIDEPLCCTILWGTAKTLGIENFYLRYRPTYSSCHFGSIALTPNPDQHSRNQFLCKMKDSGLLLRIAKYSIPIRVYKCLFYSNIINTSWVSPHSWHSSCSS